MKGKRPAKLANRGKGSTDTTEEQVSIEILELTITNPDTNVTEITLVQTNHGTVERASENAPGLVDMDRAQLEGWITEAEEAGLIVSSRSLVGINYMRISYPRLDAKLVHKTGEGVCAQVPA